MRECEWTTGLCSEEVKLEAGTTPVRLSTGDWLHFYAAATPGWVDHGNYTAGWIVLDRNDPRVVLQRSAAHILIPTFPHETLCGGEGLLPALGNGTAPGGCGTAFNGGYKGERKNVVFLCSAVPVPGAKAGSRLSMSKVR